ncbi:hypothetical protein PR048_014472 [Dryococelus australis]|uniref:Uncharacterized protein n=1 Tax=Dryococelus australis TaxID=614101 RepID=A0ABQ9HEA3_9NEOP|nr:hypothetical protein PR048_014472 [Dryococelus australis]
MNSIGAVVMTCREICLLLSLETGQVGLVPPLKTGDKANLTDRKLFTARPHTKCATYLQFLQDVSAEYLEEVPLAECDAMWFQQDGAPPYFATAVRRHVDMHFPYRHIKSMAYATQLETRDELMCVATCFSAVPPCGHGVVNRDIEQTHCSHVFILISSVKVRVCNWGVLPLHLQLILSLMPCVSRGSNDGDNGEGFATKYVRLHGRDSRLFHELRPQKSLPHHDTLQNKSDNPSTAIWRADTNYLVSTWTIEDEPVSLLASHKGEPGSIPDLVLPFSHVGIVPDDAVSRRVFSGISRCPHPLILAPPHTELNQPHRLSRPRWNCSSIRLEWGGKNILRKKTIPSAAGWDRTRTTSQMHPVTRMIEKDAKVTSSATSVSVQEQFRITNNIKINKKTSQLCRIQDHGTKEEATYKPEESK